MDITEDRRKLWRRMAELAKPAHLEGEPIIALLDENASLLARVAVLEAHAVVYQGVIARRGKQLVVQFERIECLEERESELEADARELARGFAFGESPNANTIYRYAYPDEPPSEQSG
jgi:hypothetical protein